MRMCRLILLTVVLALAAAVVAKAGPLRPDEAKRFVAGKLFAYNCFDGTRGVGRIYADGAVVGTLQAPGKPTRFVAMPIGTIRITSTSICASLRSALFEPCFDVVQTSRTSFRGSISGLGFAYCDFVRRDPRVELTGGARAAPLRLRPTAAGSATQSAPVAVPAKPQPELVPDKATPKAAPEKRPSPSAAEVSAPVQSAVVTYE
jgi:hypothetical protein